MARHKDPLTIQAQTEAQLRYGQPLTDLLSARRTAHHQYESDVSTAEDTARALQRAAHQAIPQLAAIYSEADRTRKNAAHQIELATGATASAGNALAVALRGESGLATQRMAGEKARAQVETVNRGLDAVAGEAYAKKNALAGYRATRADLMSQTRGIHSQAGAFTQGRIGELQSAQAQAELDAAKFGETQRHNVATETIQSGINPATGKPIPGKGRGPTGRTPSEQRQINKISADARDAISSARVWINRLSQGNHITKAIGLLKTGGSIPVPTGQKDAQGQPKTHYVDVPKFSSDFLRAATELEGRGYLSKTSVHSLRTRNVHVPDEWLPPVRVKFHYRRPRSSGGGYADVNLPAGSR